MKLFKLIWKIPYFFFFCLFYAWEVLLSNLQVAYSVLNPWCKISPGIVAVPLDTQNDYTINLLANLITMTPGTMSVDVSTDKKMLFVYGLDVKDTEAFRKGIKTKLERLAMNLME